MSTRWRRLFALVAGCALVAVAFDVQAQRVIFPSPVQSTGSVYQTPAYTAQLPTSPATAPTPVYTAPAVPYGAAPPATTAPALPYSYAPPTTNVAPPAYSPYSTPAPAPYAAQPFDPYATPAAQPLGVAPPAYRGPTATYNEGVAPGAFKVCQEIRWQQTYIPRWGSGTSDFGTNDTELYASFGFPFLLHAPILVTPGFNFHFWDGPDSVPGVVQDLPPRVYDTYLATSWRPQITPRLAADLAVSVGLYTDFSTVSSSQIRVLGRGVGLYTLSPNWQLAGGVVYVNRFQVKLLPAFGAIWTPHPDARYEIVFPNPKLSQRLTTWGQTELWGYIAGEYGGGQWGIDHADGSHDTVNYNDLRLILGVDWFRGQRMRGNFEIGYVFNRSLIYASGIPNVNPGDTMMLRGGLSF
ncbi:MAG: hypothetical protein JSS27_11590 [Planctomycetes bacterium]|nr:hypothetical protein [Planctomycetota bacterium]